MQDYRRSIKNYFESKPYMRDLLMVDIIFCGLGLLFLLFYEFSIIRVNSDVFFALGFWFFWIGIILSFIKNCDINLTIGLGLYAVLYFVKFIISCVCSAYGYGFYGFSALFNVVVASFLLILIIKGSDYYQKHLESKKAALKPLQCAPVPKSHEPARKMIRCPQCEGLIRQDAKFCPTCGYKIPDMKRCKQCGSPLSENTGFCVVCGAKIETEASGWAKEESYASQIGAADVGPVAESIASEPVVEINMVKPEPIIKGDSALPVERKLEIQNSVRDAEANYKCNVSRWITSLHKSGQ